MLSTRVSLLRRLAGSGWGVCVKTLCKAALSLIYSTAEVCAAAWCHSAHTHLIDNVLNDVLCIVTECLRPTSTDNPPAQLRHERATFSLANRSSLRPGRILHGQVTELQAASKKRLKSRHPLVPAARKLLHNLSELGIRAVQWMNLDMAHRVL